MGIVLINYRKRGIDMSLFRVAIHYGINSNGFLSYDTEAKTVSVDLPEQEWVDKAVSYTHLDVYKRQRQGNKHFYKNQILILMTICGLYKNRGEHLS